MASPNAPKSSEQLIREHSQARVVHAALVPHWEYATRGHRQITNQDAIEQMVRKYR